MNLIYGSPKALNVIMCEKDYRQFHVVSIKPDKNGMYKKASTYVDVNSKLIDKDTIAVYSGMEETYDMEEFAVACVDFYGERFWGGNVGLITKEEAQAEINKLLNLSEEPTE